MTGSDRLREALVDRIACQWVALGVNLVGPGDHTLVDIEAVIVMTALFGRDDSRVYEGALDWGARYGSIVNATRLKAIAAEIDTDLAPLSNFAAMVAGAGGPRWPMAGHARLPYQSRGKVQVPDLRAHAVLAWRMRSAFGVAARADILTVLATLPGASLSLADLARLTRSTKRNVTLAVRALALADVVEIAVVGNEQRIRLTRHAGFRDWLGSRQPRFIDWAGRYAIVARVLSFDVAPTATPAVQAIEARALIDTLRSSIRRTDLPEPDTSVLGEPFADEFRRWRDALADAIAP
jgi:hypothetical protein